MSKLNILELHRTIQEKKNRRNESFEKALFICHKRIKSAAETEKMRTFLIVPEFIVGFPIYNLNECIQFVVNSLKKNGFLVKYYFPNILYVSWDFDEIKTDKKPPTTIQIDQPKALLQSNITTNRNGKLALFL